jgi:pilus assembly protein CpaE
MFPVEQVAGDGAVTLYGTVPRMRGAVVAHKLCVYRVQDVAPELVPGYSIVVSTTDLHELLTALSAFDADAVLLDLDAPDAIRTIARLTEAKPRLAVVGVTARADIQRVISAQRAGCAQVTTRPLDAADLTAALQRARGHQPVADQPGGGRVFAVLGSIGGAGTTSIATHLAVELAYLTKDATALFDLDFEYGGVADAFDLAPRYTLADVATAGKVDADLLSKASTALPLGIHVFARPHTIQEAHAIDESAVRDILRTAAATYAHSVLDLPRCLSPVAGVAIEECTKLILVLQLTVPSVKNAQRIIAAVRAEGFSEELIERVVNRYDERANSCATEPVERQLGRRILATVPSDFKAVHTALDLGNPLTHRNKVRAAIRALATRLAGQTVPANRTGWRAKLGLAPR